jgi:hypothetical protein
MCGGRNIGLPPLLHVQRVPSIQGRVKDVGRMSTFAQRDLDGVFFVRFPPTIVAFVQLESSGELNLPFPSE